jgi:hypothetical protein
VETGFTASDLVTRDFLEGEPNLPQRGPIRSALLRLSWPVELGHFPKTDFSGGGKVEPRNDRFFTVFGFQVSDNLKLTPTGAFLMATHVLDHDAPGLAGRLRALNSESRRKVVVKASLFAAQRMSELNANTQALLDRMRFSCEVSPQEAISAMVLSEAADDQYFKLQEEGAPAELWRKSFSLGRLLRG